MTELETHIIDDEGRAWQLQDDLGNDVTIRKHEKPGLVLVSAWDKKEMVHEPIAAIQLESLTWWAEGYAQAKE